MQTTNSDVSRHLKKSLQRTFELPVVSSNIVDGLKKYYKNEVNRRGGVYEETDALRESFVSIANFLADEKKRFALCLVGSVGNGKSTMAVAIRDVINYLISNNKTFLNPASDNSYVSIVKARDLSEWYKSDMKSFKKAMTKQVVIIDDVGEDLAEISVYGHIHSPFVEFVEYRYDHMLPFVITSNLGSDGIYDKYNNERFRDRMHEIAKGIKFKDKSFRK